MPQPSIPPVYRSQAITGEKGAELLLLTVYYKACEMMSGNIRFISG
jgi:hypothetical protein